MILGKVASPARIEGFVWNEYSDKDCSDRNLRALKLEDGYPAQGSKITAHNEKTEVFVARAKHLSLRVVKTDQHAAGGRKSTSLVLFRHFKLSRRVEALPAACNCYITFRSPLTWALGGEFQSTMQSPKMRILLSWQAALAVRKEHKWDRAFPRRPYDLRRPQFSLASRWQPQQRWPDLSDHPSTW